MTPPADYPRRVAGLQVHEVEDGYIVSDARGARVHHLNATAAFIIELCTGEHSIADIAELVRETWQLRDRPEQDVRDLVARLRDEGLVA